MGSIRSRAIVLGLVAAFALLGGVAGGQAPPDPGDDTKRTPTGGRQGGPAAPPSGSYEWKDVEFGTGITECPQARLKKVFQDPLDRRTIDRAEQYSEGGNDRRVNEEYSCFPQNETAIDVNPVVPRNLIAANAQSSSSSTCSTSMRNTSQCACSWRQNRVASPWPRYSAERSGKTPEVLMWTSGSRYASQASQSSRFQASYPPRSISELVATPFMQPHPRAGTASHC